MARLGWAQNRTYATNPRYLHFKFDFIRELRLRLSAKECAMDGLTQNYQKHVLHPRVQRLSIRCIARGLTLALLLALTANLHAQNTPVVGGPGAVLLKHGDVISGELAPMGDQISIRIDENNSVFIPVRQIEISARSIEEIYQYKIKKYGRIGTGEHYQMALWCLKNKMNDQAIAHYEELKQMVPNDPIVKRLAIQIKETVLQEPWAQELIRQQAQHKVAQAQSTGVVTASSDSSQEGGVQTAGLRLSSQKTSTERVPRERNALSGSGTSASTSTTPAATRPQSIPRSGTQPQTFATGETTAKPMTFQPVVTDEATKLFRSHLQPILIQKCGQAGCHGAQSANEPKILRPAANSTKKTADNNIAALVPFIDAADANKSKLYQMATRPHGTQRTGALGQIDNDGSDELLGWIKLVIFQTQQNSFGSNVSLGPNGLPLSPNGSTQLWQQHLDRLPSGGAGGLATQGDRPNLNDAPVVSMQNYDSLIQKPFVPDISKEITPSELDKLDEEVRRAEAAERGEAATKNPVPSGDPFDPNAFNNQFRKPE